MPAAAGLAVAMPGHATLGGDHYICFPGPRVQRTLQRERDAALSYELVQHVGICAVFLDDTFCVVLV